MHTMITKLQPTVVYVSLWKLPKIFLCMYAPMDTLSYQISCIMAFVLRIFLLDLLHDIFYDWSKKYHTGGSLPYANFVFLGSSYKMNFSVKWIKVK